MLQWGINKWTWWWRLPSIATSHWRSGSSLMARYSWTNACGWSDLWSSPSRLRHCCLGSPCDCTLSMSSGPMTSSWNRKSMYLAALMLSTTVEWNFLNLTFNAAFDSTTQLVYFLLVHFTSLAILTFVNSVVSAHTLISKQPVPLPPPSFTPNSITATHYYYSLLNYQLTRPQ